jgi:DNA-binding MurR/RpiR family transcriptional regulator
MSQKANDKNETKSMSVTLLVEKGGFFLRIKALHQSLKKAELRLADYILNHPQEVAQATIHELQEKSGSSYATIIRFSKKAGYSGFREFKNSLAHDLEQPTGGTNIAAAFQIESNEPAETIIQKTFLNSINTLEETRQILNARELEKAVAKILAAGEVYIVGTGISGVSAQYAFTRFFRIGIRCSWEIDPTIYKLQIATMKNTDVLFAISSSGRSANIVDAARIARENGVAVISLCDFAISPLTRISDINLYTTPRNSTQFYDLDVQLITAQLNIIDVLFFCCCSKMGRKAIDLITKTKMKADREKL